MKNEENLILMYRNYRLFSFHVDYQNQKVKVIDENGNYTSMTLCTKCMKTVK